MTTTAPPPPDAFVEPTAKPEGSSWHLEHKVYCQPSQFDLTTGRDQPALYYYWGVQPGQGWDWRTTPDLGQAQRSFRKLLREYDLGDVLPETKETDPRSRIPTPDPSAPPGGTPRPDSPQPSLSSNHSETRGSTGTGTHRAHNRPPSRAMSSASAASPTGITAKAYKIPSPPDWDGERPGARNFLTYCTSILRALKDVLGYKTDEEKILYVLFNMKNGKALTWAAGRMEIAERLNPPDYGTWADFQKDFKNSFISIADTTDARNELLMLKQGNLSVDEYNSQFNTLIMRCNYRDVDEHITTYRNGLKQSILLNIARTGNIPVTLDGWFRRASAIDNAERETRNILNSFSPSTNKSTSSNQRKWNPKSNDSSTAKPFNPVPKMTPEERERCRKEGLCFRCRESGHNSANCPKFKNGYQSKTIRAADTAQETGSTSNPSSNTNASNDNQEPAEIAATIRRLLANLSEDKREKVYTDLDDKGFY